LAKCSTDWLYLHEKRINSVSFEVIIKNDDEDCGVCGPRVLDPSIPGSPIPSPQLAIRNPLLEAHTWGHVINVCLLHLARGEKKSETCIQSARLATLETENWKLALDIGHGTSDSYSYSESESDGECRWSCLSWTSAARR